MFGRLTGPHGLSQFTLASLIKWGEHLAIGHPEIDAQHEAIFGLAAKAHELWRQRARAAAVRPLVERMQNVLSAHFRFEEKVLAEASYPRLDQHQQEHALMLRDLAAIRRRLAAKSGSAGIEPAWTVLNYMLGVSIGHVLSSDFEYCRHLAARDSREQEAADLSHAAGDRAGPT